MPNAVDNVTDVQLAEALRGAPTSAPARSEWPALIEAADDHGVLPLLADAAAAAKWDRDLLAVMRPAVAAETALEILRQRELRRVLDALAAAGVKPLIIKGSHLAFTHYRSPDRRPRLDTDLLIREIDKPQVISVLSSLDYHPLPYVTGEVAFSQFSYQRIDERRIGHTLDVHWRIAIPKAFADRLTYDDLLRDAVNVGPLGPNAFAPSPVLALLIACLHRTAHHGTAPRLLWLYDIHLLANGLSQTQWVEVVSRARQTGLSLVVGSGLESAADRLATSIPETVIQQLHAEDSATDADVLMFLAAPPSQWRVAASDWRRLHGARDRLRFLREHLFPSPDYMRHRYNVSGSALLPLLYVHRAVTGAVKWVRRPL